MLVGVVISIGAGFIIGFLSNLLKGPYFVLSTIAFSQVLLIGVSRWRGFTAGGEGIPVPFRPGFATLGLGHLGWVYMALTVALVCYAVEVFLERSRVGYQLAGVREDEDAAEALGIPTRKLKVGAVASSAALPFGNLSVIDNVMIGALTRLPTVSSARLEAERVVETCGLAAHATCQARGRANPAPARRRPDPDRDRADPGPSRLRPGKRASRTGGPGTRAPRRRSAQARLSRALARVAGGRR
jgi:hypothetical protein